MPLIDQRILISAPPEGVWRILSDSNQLSRWHAGYRGVSVLTTQSTGVGTRRRCTLVTGKDVIEEITAWVDGWGYEYRLVEGGPYKTLQGRVRLQAGPDGTSVQWTLAYQPRGVAGALRDRLGGQRGVQEMMAASLRQLRRAVEELGVRLDDEYRARVAIRDRLNADERAQYQRRHPSPEMVEAAANELDEAAPQPPVVAELPGAEGKPSVRPEDDTEPKPPRELREALAAQESPAAPVDVPATQADVPPEHAAFAPPAAPPVEAVPDASLPAENEVIPDYKRATPPRGIPAVRPSAAPVPAEPVPPPIDVSPPPAPAGPGPDQLTDQSEPARAPTAVSVPPRQEMQIALADDRVRPSPLAVPQTPKHDTGELSIWEVFGLRRPSEQDSEVLDSLVQSVQARELSNRLVHGRIPKRPVRARGVAVQLGLRLRLALEGAAVRFHRRWGRPVE